MSRDQTCASGSIYSRYALWECIIGLQDALSIVPHSRWYTISSCHTVISGPGNISTISAPKKLGCEVARLFEQG